MPGGLPGQKAAELDEWLTARLPAQHGGSAGWCSRHCLSVNNTSLHVLIAILCGVKVPPQLRDAFEAAVREGRIRSMQNKSMAARPLHQAGALLLGDSFNMRHPLTGKYLPLA